jgi:hypothetical protein
MKFSKTHGLRGHALYSLWQSIKSRCSNPKVTGYRYYGGRGVAVCDRWLGVDGFPNFIGDMGVRPDGFVLRLIDPYANYSPDNCRWGLRKRT